MLNYPAPRYLKFKRPKSVEELMPKARELVNQPPGQPFYSFKPSYDISRCTGYNKIIDAILFISKAGGIKAWRLSQLLERGSPD